MARIILATEGQKLIKVECPKIASGDKNVDYLRVEFCPNWDGFAKTAVFYRNEREVYYAVMDNNNECVIPWEVLQNEGFLYLGVFGSKGDTRKTSEVISYKIDKGAIVDDLKPSDPTPDIYDQILSNIAAHAENKNNPHGVTADQVGARPNTWTPTADQVGAAPAGYGLGKLSASDPSTCFTTKEEVDAAIYSGFWVYKSQGAPLVSVDTNTQYVKGLTIAYSDRQTTQIAWCVYSGTCVVRERKDTVWLEWEFVNPPMSKGVEYRTTERYGGGAVYAKRVSYVIGANVAPTDYHIPHGIANFGEIVHFSARLNEYPFPVVGSGGGISSVLQISTQSVILRSYNRDLTAATYVFDLYYTKTS